MTRFINCAVSNHLKRLADQSTGRVFEITKNDNGTFRIEECCDNYFSLDLTAEELRELAAEIVALSRS